MLKKQKGYSLIELLIVMALTVSVFYGLFALYSEYVEKKQAESFYLDIISMVNFIENKYKSGTDVDGINSATLHKMGFKTNGIKFDQATQEYKHSYTPKNYFGGQIGEVHFSTIPYRLSLAYQIRISGVKSGYICSEVARKVRSFGQFTEIQIAGTQLTQGDSNSITGKMIDEACRSQQIISFAFIKDTYI